MVKFSHCHSQLSSFWKHFFLPVDVIKLKDSLYVVKIMVVIIVIYHRPSQMYYFVLWLRSYYLFGSTWSLLYIVPDAYLFTIYLLSCPYCEFTALIYSVRKASIISLSLLEWGSLLCCCSWGFFHLPYKICLVMSFSWRHHILIIKTLKRNLPFPMVGCINKWNWIELNWIIYNTGKRTDRKDELTSWW